MAVTRFKDTDGNWVALPTLRGADGAQSEYYSEEEIKIGTWTDGKPLYRRVYLFDNVANNSNYNVATMENVEKVGNLYGFFRFKQDAESNVIPVNCINTTAYTSSADFTDRVLRFQPKWGSSKNEVTGYIIIEYTKITDKAEPVDRISEDYSTEETYTGQHWVDGKPIYRKVVHVASQTYNAKTDYVLCTIPDIAYVTNLNEKFVRTDGTFVRMPNCSITLKGDSSIHLYPYELQGTGELDVIIEYTKTTD